MDTRSLEESLPWLRLTLVPGVSPRAQRGLLRRYGSPQAVLEAPDLECALGEERAAALRRGPGGELVERTLRWLAGDGRRLLALGDPDYPPLLLQTPDPPTVLYAQGDVSVLRRDAVAIVGSRNATPQGIRDARAFARGLSEAGLCVVSGLALGIDAAAHTGGLEGPGSSIAVLGTGADIRYPHRNRELAAQLAARGCVLSEFALGTPPSSGNFPRRNRLISGLARGVLVVEAGRPSGSLVTAQLAVEQSREVFAIPGSIHSPMSKGCHALIQEGAKLVQTVDDVVEELRGPLGMGTAPARPARPQEPAHRLLRALGFAPLSLDELALSCRLPVAKLSADITRLELDGLVRTLPDGRLQRVCERS